MRSLLATGILIGMALLLPPVMAGAAPLDGSVPILCAVNSVMECDDGSCERITAEETKIPSFVRIDVPKKILSSVDGARTSPITQGPADRRPDYGAGHAKPSDLGSGDQRADRPDVGRNR